MKQSSFAQMLRGLVHDFYNEDGSIRTNKKGFGGYSLTENSTKILELLVEVIIKTEYFGEDVKQYLKGYSIEEIKNMNNEDVSVNTLKSRLYYQINRLKKELGEEVVEQILTTKSKEVLMIYYKKIKAIEKEAKGKSLLDNMTLKMPKGGEVDVCYIEEDKLEVLNDLVIRYSKVGKKISEEQFNGEMVGYIRYLERKYAKGCLEGDELERFELFKRYLG